MNQQIWAGWHMGQVEPESDAFTVTGMLPLGVSSTITLPTQVH